MYQRVVLILGGGLLAIHGISHADDPAAESQKAIDALRHDRVEWEGQQEKIRENLQRSQARLESLKSSDATREHLRQDSEKALEESMKASAKGIVDALKENKLAATVKALKAAKDLIRGQQLFGRLQEIDLAESADHL